MLYRLSRIIFRYGQHVRKWLRDEYASFWQHAHTAMRHATPLVLLVGQSVWRAGRYCVTVLVALVVFVLQYMAATARVVSLVPKLHDIYKRKIPRRMSKKIHLAGYLVHRAGVGAYAPVRAHLRTRLVRARHDIHGRRSGAAKSIGAKRLTALRPVLLRTSAVFAVLVVMIINIFLPALQARASSLTWSSNADFTTNKIGKCQNTTIDNIVVSGSSYGDPTCAATGQDASMSLSESGAALTGVATISAGGSHSLALKIDGTVWAWGANGNGQLGDGTTTNRTLPVQVKDPAGTGYLSNIITVSAGNDHSLALKTDGTVWGWGSNWAGQLGDNTTTNRTLPVQVKDSSGTGYLSGISAISAGGYHSLALKIDGTVWAWGYNGSGQLGDNTITQRIIPVQVKDSSGAGYLSGISTVSAGYFHSLALKNDGTVWAWGTNTNGQLGDNTTTQRNLPVQVKDSAGTGYLSGISTISAGNSHSFALKNDGTVWAWGTNTNGQLGDNTTTQRNLPVQVKDSSGTGYLSGISAISIGYTHSLALKNDGTVWAWGGNSSGQAAVVAEPVRSASRRLPGLVLTTFSAAVLTGIEIVSTGSNHSLALKTDGTVWAWASNSYGELGDGTNSSRSLPVQVKDSSGTGYLSGISAISAGAYHSVALKTDGTVWAWGANWYGQLGDGTNSSRSLPVQVKDSAGTGYLSGISVISAGGSRSLALKTDGTVWAWGANSSGQLGDGTTTQRNLPVQVKDSAGTGNLSSVSTISAGTDYSLALKTDGTVWAWGGNGNGQLGENTFTQRILPVQAKDSAGTGYLSGISAISAGNSHSFALKNDGTVWAWGHNGSGQLGDGTTTQRNLPVQVKDSTGTGYLSGISAISAGYYHSLALKTDGTVWAWGDNGSGKLGVWSETSSILPVQTLAGVYFIGGYAPVGTASGYIVDAGDKRRAKWSNVSWTTDPLPTDTVVKISARTSQDNLTWSNWTDYAQNTVGSTTETADMSALPATRYLELKTTLQTGGAMQNTPTLHDFTLQMLTDVTPPDTNASGVRMYHTNTSESEIADGSWNNSPTPYFAWQDATDNSGGAGIAGYCLYLGQDNTADVTQTKGNYLGNSPLNSNGLCPYAVSGNSFDLSAQNVLANTLSTASNQQYYLLAKAFDSSNNVFAGNAVVFSFKQDVMAPSNVQFVSLPGQFVATKDVTMTWPTSGAQAASDANSGLAGVQYRIGTTGTWYGAAHNGKQDITDVLPSGGSYQTDPTYDYPLLDDGNNMIFFRSIDNAGNVSETLTTAVIKLNTASPSSPQNLSVSPETNTENSFAFSWAVPATYVGQVNGVSYCYTVNTLPTDTTCTYTAAGQTDLAAGAYATQPGDNTFYVVAKDEAGNINYDTVASAIFKANTAAPGIPLNTEIADVSVKATQSWKLALSWEQPTNIGAGVASYRVSRSTSGPDSGYTQIATTQGNSYVDTGLSAVTYYYKIKACDSSNNCGAETAPVNKLPTGRFTAAAEMIGTPSVQVGTRKATIHWTTERDSDSRVQNGTTSGAYNDTEAAVSAQTKVHTVGLTGLQAGTTYYYKAKWTDEDGNIGKSSEMMFTTLPAPAVMEVAVVKKSLTTATIRFTSKDATNVKIVYGKSQSFGGVKSINTSQSESTYTVELDGLDDGATYYFRPDATDSDGYVYEGNIVSFVTPSRPRITNLRFQPLSGEPTSTQQVTWTTNVPTSSVATYGLGNANGTDVSDSKYATEHAVTIRNLKDDSNYFLLAQSRDADGNLAVSDRQYFRTALDTRPPKVSDVSTEASIKGTGGDARGQIVVTWQTDEPTTSQVAYGPGTSSGTYTNSTVVDTRLTTEHTVVISDLKVSSVYYLRPISADGANNITKADEQSAIIGRPTDNVLTIVLNALYRTFGL